MKNKTLYRVLTTVLIIAAIVGIVYFVNASINKPKNTQPQTLSSATSTNQSILNNKISLDYGMIIYAQKTADFTNIYKINFKDNKPIKIFTDKDESEKIKFVSNATYNGRVLVMMTPKQEEFIGNLYLIRTDGSGNKDKVASDFASISSPIISPDGTKIVYTQFSNAEADYGFKLIVANYDNSSKREIAKDNSGIIIFVWSPDSKKIAYSKGSSQNNTEIHTVAEDGKNDSVLYKLDGSLISMDWGNNNKFVLSSGPKQSKTNEQVEIYSLENNKLSKLTNNNVYDAFPHFSKDNNLISYISIKPTDQPLNYSSGKLNVMDYFGNNTTEITDGNYIIGNL